MAESKLQDLELPAIVDLDTLDVIRDNLLEALELGSVQINSEKVERVATNALLMLLSAARSAELNNTSFEVLNASPQMLGAIDRLGLKDSFTPLLKG